MPSSLLHPDNMLYCKGCGHIGITRSITEVIEELGIYDMVVLMKYPGCGYRVNEIDVASSMAAHGRNVSTGTGIKISDPGSIVICVGGDGDLSGIGLEDTLHGARRNENLTVIMVNNHVYGMTGGQASPTTIEGKVTPTTPYGSDYSPIDMGNLVTVVNPNAYVYRGSIKSANDLAQLKEAITKGIQRQVRGDGFSFIEIKSPCPISIFRERNSPKKTPSSDQYTSNDSYNNLIKRYGRVDTAPIVTADLHLRISLSGIGSQGVQTLGKKIADTFFGLGYFVTYVPEYSPEKSGGPSTCELAISSKKIVNPLDPEIDVAILLDQDFSGLENKVKVGGYIFYDTAKLTPNREGVTYHGFDIKRLAQGIGRENDAMLKQFLRWFNEGVKSGGKTK